MNIEEMVNMARAGDREALLELVFAAKEELYKLSYIYLRNQADCEDVLQDLVLIIYDNLHKLRNPSSFYPWVRRIVINSCYRKLKHSHKVLSLDRHQQNYANDTASMQQITANFPAEGGLGGLENQLDLLQALDSLPKPQKDVIILHYFVDLKIDDVGEVLDCPSGTVKSRLHKALAKLRKELGGDNE